jgi:eukaryotic-like serine/threonine-protein kinase
MTRPDSPPASRLVLGRYRLARRLGAGGFGVVWLGWDERLEREVAVKVVPRDEGSDGRVEREARAAARLNHPGIVALYELAYDDHDVFLVSELVRGRTLAELAAAGAVSDHDVARIGGALCDALEHAHERGVIHRDLKPANVMVLAEPAAGAGFAKLADFGVAHLVSGESLTRTGDVVGTLAYMAPEQAEGERVTGACDVYSLALTLYEAWTGENPVRAAGPAATARRVGRPVPSLASRRRDFPLELCAGLDRALDRSPDRRPSPGALGAELRAAEGQLSEEGGLVEPETLQRFGLTAVRRRPGLLRPRAAAEHGGDRSVAPALARLGAGAAAGLLMLLGLTQLGPEPSFSAPAAAGAVAALVTLLPRLGWLCAALALCGWLASPEAGRPGAALLVAAALAPTPFLLPRAGVLWSLPALAPALGTVALAPAFVGVAALAPTTARRAGLGGAGFLWLAAAELLTGDSLLFGAPDGALPRAAWEGSLSGAASEALLPLVGSPALAPLAVWALFAALLPLVVRGRFLPLDLVAAGTWAVALVAAHAALADVLAATTELHEARGAAAGALVGAVAALSAIAVARPGVPERPSGTTLRSA